jgi:hypothetical protein
MPALPLTGFVSPDASILMIAKHKTATFFGFEAASAAEPNDSSA